MKISNKATTQSNPSSQCLWFNFQSKMCPFAEWQKKPSKACKSAWILQSDKGIQPSKNIRLWQDFFTNFVLLVCWQHGLSNVLLRCFSRVFIWGALLLTPSNAPCTRSATLDTPHQIYSAALLIRFPQKHWFHAGLRMVYCKKKSHHSYLHLFLKIFDNHDELSHSKSGESRINTGFSQCNPTYLTLSHVYQICCLRTDAESREARDGTA